MKGLNGGLSPAQDKPSAKASLSSDFLPSFIGTQLCLLADVFSEAALTL